MSACLQAFLDLKSIYIQISQKKFLSFAVGTQL